MLFKNTLAQSSTLLTSQLFSVILAPLMLGRYGFAVFGVWAVSGALARYAGVLDFGVTRSLSRFVALHHAHEDHRAIRETVGLGLITVTSLGAVALFAAAAGAAFAARELGVLSPEAMRIVLVSSAVVFLAQAFCGCFSSIAIGMRRMTPPNVAGVTGNVVNFAFSVAAIVVSSDIVVYAVANAAAEILRIVFVYVSVRTVWSGRMFALPGRARAREVLSYGIKSQVEWLSTLINFQTDKIIIAVFFGPAVTGVYEVASRVAFAARSVGILTLSALIPTATAEMVTHGREIARDYYERYTLRSVSIAFPLFVASCIGAPFLFAAWLGEAPEEAASILVMLTVASFVNVSSGVAHTLTLADGRAGLVAATAGLSAAANLVLTVAFAPLFGLWGVLAGTVVAMTVAALVFLHRFHRLFDLSWRDYARAVGPPTAVALGLAVPFGAFDLLVGSAPRERFEALGMLLLVVGPYGLAYWLVTSRLGYLPERLRAPWVRPRKATPAPSAR